MASKLFQAYNLILSDLRPWDFYFLLFQIKLWFYGTGDSPSLHRSGISQWSQQAVPRN
jgi:hypothetical protein